MVFPDGLEPEEEAEIFLQTLFEPDDLVEFRGLTTQDGPTRQTWTKAPYRKTLVELQDWNAAGFNIYVGANPRSRRRGTAEDVALARSHCADFDETGIKIGHARQRVRDGGYPEPSVWVHSGRGLQCWWRLDEPIVAMDSWSRRQRRIIEKLGTDPRIHDPPRIMRLPGYHNLKYPHHPISVLMAVAS